ncbi:MAG: isoprenylcysteine carboxylmethyltransferase family protein [Ahrensia sp.]|nr:isoprenylcysteine carboxylmethyltransferase family protein [Ahrensia sp.]
MGVLTLLDYVVIAIALATLGSYIWSVKSHFETSARQAGTRLIDVMVFTSAVLYTLLTLYLAQHPFVQGVGIAVMLGALALFWLTIRETRHANLLAAFSDKNPGSLVTTGPYALVRHPFYASYVLFWFGFAISTANIFAVGLSMVMVFVYLRAAKQEEEKFARTPMAEEYAAFAKGRKRFIPFVL